MKRCSLLCIATQSPSMRGRAQRPRAPRQSCQAWQQPAQHTRMQRRRGQLEDVQQRRDAPRSRHSVCENQGAPRVRGQEVVQQLVPLLLSAVQRGLLNLW